MVPLHLMYHVLHMCYIFDENYLICGLALFDDKIFRKILILAKDVHWSVKRCNGSTVCTSQKALHVCQNFVHLIFGIVDPDERFSMTKILGFIVCC